MSTRSGGSAEGVTRGRRPPSDPRHTSGPWDHGSSGSGGLGTGGVPEVGVQVRLVGRTPGEESGIVTSTTVATGRTPVRKRVHWTRSGPSLVHPSPTVTTKSDR